MAEAEGSRRRKVLIVGAGPVGALTALSLDKRGWDVEVWDAREGPQSPPVPLATTEADESRPAWEADQPLQPPLDQPGHLVPRGRGAQGGRSFPVRSVLGGSGAHEGAYDTPCRRATRSPGVRSGTGPVHQLDLPATPESASGRALAGLRPDPIPHQALPIGSTNSTGVGKERRTSGTAWTGARRWEGGRHAGRPRC